MTKYTIELIEEHERVNIYSIRLKGEKLSELERFFDSFPEGSKYDEEINTLIAWLDKIGETGALERYFRHEGSYGDGVSAIPIETSHLRLYCIRLSDSILVFGNGGVKDAATWQESDTLTPHVEILKDTSRYIASRLENGSLYAVGKDLIGNLNFTRDETKQHN